MDGSTLFLNNVLITGGTSGLGLELVKLFLEGGWGVYTTGRDPERLPLHNNKLHFVPVDFSDLKAVAETANKLIRLSTRFDLIINNAGILSPPLYTSTKDGFEYTFQVNFLAHLLFDDLIISNRKNSASLTIVSVTSPVYKYVRSEFMMSGRQGYRSYKTYAGSKVLVLLIGEYLRNKYPGKKLKFIGYDPGTFSSGICRMQKRWFQHLYKIAAPFMRRPANVAKILYGILLNPESLEGVIYDVNGRIKQIPFSNSDQIRRLFNECEQKLSAFLAWGGGRIV